MVKPPCWQTTRFQIDLTWPRVMGIVNITPDSFSDGGRHADASAAIAHAERLLREGADLLDIGGESTRPGAAPVSAEEEAARVMPVLRAAIGWGVPVSVDTHKPALMRVALDAGVDIVNDITALRADGAEALVAAHPSCGVVLMHMHGEPRTMQQAPMAGDAVEPCAGFLRQRLERLDALGVANARVVLDPGVGFGKTVGQNFSLLARQRELLALDRPLLVGWSRKSSLGAVTGLGVADRLLPSVAAALLAAERGARILRVHDVRETVQALAVWRAASPVPADEAVPQ